MNSFVRLCKTLFVSTGICLLSVPPTYGIQPTRLLTAETTYNQASAWGATYYFTLKLPASSVNVPLKQLAFTQVEGLETIDFDDKNSIAFVETNGQREKLGVTLAKKGNQPQTLIVTFDQPVASGKTITIGLKPFRNPTYEGIYQFRVQSLPFGERTNNLVLGTARLQFYGNTGNE
ncbi:DUF2808 domain-containing protein [Trichormus variabilis]|uniref:DUF2808 domain-containing protein n=1 Tax=Trichormus variabilis SAG 1403-4b TaxID=447716 RepID=A0A3S1BNV7_ANAVA|nr:DUF2808 domain-containing protein [Trichormus variabilis]MBD2629807.1 DUF2808 domain-containing protein [Trichormus variabilis FACHB-164]RUS92442.1 hypothetical protein DSM107003_50720 [Trichormus variabilis SAG 1403-4b]